jgi:hypothetical protein
MTVEIDAAALGITDQDGKHSTTFEIRHVATGANKKIYPEFRHKAMLAFDAPTYERVKTSGLRIASQFELPGGRYQVRVATASSDRNGSVVYDLEVPDFDDGPLTMSGVALTTASAGEVFTLRQDATRSGKEKVVGCGRPVCTPISTVEGSLAPWPAGGRSAAAPLLQDVLPAPPTTARDFRASDTLAVFAEIYNNVGRGEEAGTIAMTAELRDTSNQIVRTVSDQRPSRTAKRPSGGHGFTLRLPLEGVPAGSYVLHVEARSDRGEENAVSRNIPIRVR